MAKPVIAPALIHGFIDPYAPGGLEKLFAFRRAQFGDAVMSATGGEGAGAGGNENGGADGTAGGAGGSENNGTAGTAGAGGDEQLGEGGKKALEAERAEVKRLKTELAERDGKITAFENAGKTDEEKREQALKDAQATGTQTASQLAASQLTVLQYQVAATKGLDLEAAERLRGSTKEELEADADAWIKKWGKASGNGIVPGAGASGSNEQVVTPGMGRLRQGYEQSSRK